MPECDKSAEALFYRAIELPDAARHSFLDQACNGNADLRGGVDKLLRHHAVDAEFLEHPPVNAIPVIDAAYERAGAQVGRYKLIGHLGEGGFGIVYHARQTDPVERDVALKIIKPGMDTQEVISRFDAERQAIAMMDHSNIARALDAGATASGQPYFVMELVHGLPITDFCTQHRLGIRERLRLFIEVCQGIQHAHQKGVIHRDIKPSNVLVTQDGQKAIPKIIDFGVAKATRSPKTHRTLLTDRQQLLGTPLYMSPEQAQMGELNVDTRSDVYSLGVLLYELLTDVTPFDRSRLKAAPFDELLKIIREEDPPRPSARVMSSGQDVASGQSETSGSSQKLAQLLQGDPDWIVMKAMEKDRSRRYPTASAFADDIQRYLDDQPVLARPPSAVYRLRKFARRNRTMCAAVSIAVLTLVLGTIAAAQIAITATKARAVAQAIVRQQTSLSLAAHESSGEQRFSGWRQRARAFVQEANRFLPGASVTAAYTRTLDGVDANVIHQWLEGTGRIRFIQDGSQVVRAIPGGGVNVLELASGTVQRLEREANAAALGPLGCDALGNPMQARFVAPDRICVTASGDESGTLTLDLPHEHADALDVGEWESLSDEAQSNWLNRLDFLAQSTADLSRIISWHGLPARLTGQKQSEGVICLWNGGTGDLLQTIIAPEAVLALSDSGLVYAVAGDEQGHVAVYEAGDSEPAMILRTGMSRIAAMSIGLDPRFPAVDHDALASGYVLAVADQLGSVGIWDLSTQAPLSLFRDIVHTVNAVQFSPDSRVLAVASHGSTQFRDTFNGDHILNLVYTQYRNDVAWSPDGSMLAISGEGRNVNTAAQVWRIETGRGVRALRGLSSATARVVFSHDNQRVAALANDWTVGIWDIPTGRLIRCLRVPPGFYVDNCGMQFSRDGSSFYLSAARTASSWNVASGELEQQWNLPTGLQDCLAATVDGQMLLMRYEPETGTCTLRNLSVDDKVQADWKGYSGRIHCITSTRDGSVFVTEGETNAGDRFTMIVNPTVPNMPITLPAVSSKPSPVIAIADDAGLLMRRKSDNSDGPLTLVTRLSDGREVARLPFVCSALSKDGTLGLIIRDERQVVELFDVVDKTMVVQLELRSMPGQYGGVFSPSGEYAAWGNLDGTVSLCEIKKVQSDLGEINAHP